MTLKGGSNDAYAPIAASVIPSYGTDAENVVIDEGDPPVAEEMSPLVTTLDANKDLTPTWRDFPFAVLFYVHFAVMLWLGLIIAPRGFDRIEVNFTAIEDEIRKGDDITEEQLLQVEIFATEAGKYIQVFPERILTYQVYPIGVVAFAISFLVTVFVIKPFPKMMVYGCLIESFALMATLMIAASIASRSIFLWIMTGVSLTAIVYYVMIAWRMAPFAAVNLKVALEGISRNCGMYVVAFIFAKLFLAYIMFWFYTVIGFFGYMGSECAKTHPNATLGAPPDEYDNSCDPPGIVILLLLLSLSWTTTIAMNMIQVTVAGVVGTWCYAKDDANGCCSTAVWSSLYRSMTYSFGSVCLGSLLQALISLFRFIVEQARNQRDRNDGCDGCGSLFLCILECIASLLEDLIYVFNQFAFIYAGIYGLSYLQSGKRVMDLFRARGWTTIITNNLVGYVLSFTTFTVAVVSGGVAMLIERCVNARYGGQEDDYASYIFGPVPGFGFWSFGIGLIIGAYVCTIVMNVVKGAVNTIIVCWADSPTVFEMNHPKLTREMAESWTSVFPEINVIVQPAYGTASYA